MPVNPNLNGSKEKFTKLRKAVFWFSSQVLFFLGLVAFILIIYDIGFKYGPETERAIHRTNSFLLLVFFLVLFYRFLIIVVWRTVNKNRWLEIVLLSFFVLALAMRFL